MQPHSSYLMCATPRSGSTLLCEALTHTGIAGFPKEYFETLKDTGLPRRPMEYFETWNNTEIAELLGEYSQFNEESIELVKWDASNYSNYLAKTFKEGTTPNGIFGAKLMWGYFDDLISNLRLIPDYTHMPVRELLPTVFPNLQYILVTRRDKVRPAISLWKAIQTWTWKMEDSIHQSDASFPRLHKLLFHYDAIDYLVQQFEAHEEMWQHFFEECSVEPLTIVYEEFEVTYEATTFKVLQYLNIPIPENHLLAERKMKKQADALSDAWVQQYFDLKSKQYKPIL